MDVLFIAAQVGLIIWLYKDSEKLRNSGVNIYPGLIVVGFIIIFFVSILLTKKGFDSGQFGGAMKLFLWLAPAIPYLFWRVFKFLTNDESSNSTLPPPPAWSNGIMIPCILLLPLGWFLLFFSGFSRFF